LRRISVALIVLSAAASLWAHHSTESWKFESNPPAWFRRVGVGKVDFAKAIGQTVTMQGVLAKDDSLCVYPHKITLPDGSALELVNPDDVK